MSNSDEGELSARATYRDFRQVRTEEYELYRAWEMRQLESDFDRAMKQLTQKEADDNDEQS